MSLSDSDQNGDRVPQAAPSSGHREHADATAAGEVRTPRTAVDILQTLRRLQEQQFQQQLQQLQQQEMLIALMHQLAPSVSTTLEPVSLPPLHSTQQSIDRRRGPTSSLLSQLKPPQNFQIWKPEDKMHPLQGGAIVEPRDKDCLPELPHSFQQQAGHPLARAPA